VKKATGEGAGEIQGRREKARGAKQRLERIRRSEDSRGRGRANEAAGSWTRRWSKAMEVAWCTGAMEVGARQWRRHGAQESWRQDPTATKRRRKLRRMAEKTR
jgi:hypothetical protein